MQQDIEYLDKCLNELKNTSPEEYQKIKEKKLLNFEETFDYKPSKFFKLILIGDGEFFEPMMPFKKIDNKRSIEEMISLRMDSIIETKNLSKSRSDSLTTSKCPTFHISGPSGSKRVAGK
jgi:hypothetical protein